MNLNWKKRNDGGVIMKYNHYKNKLCQLRPFLICFIVNIQINCVFGRNFIAQRHNELHQEFADLRPDFFFHTIARYHRKRVAVHIWVWKFNEYIIAIKHTVREPLMLIPFDFIVCAQVCKGRYICHFICIISEIQFYIAI